MKQTKRMVAFMLSLVMIIGLIPVKEVKADTSAAITLGSIQWVDAEKTSYRFPNATANFSSNGQKIFCLSVSDGGYFVPGIEVDLGGSGVTITGISQESGTSEATTSIVKNGKYSSITVVERTDELTGSITNEKIQNFLRNLTFYRNGVDVAKEQKVTVLGNQVKLEDDMTAMAIDGVIHYYKYVKDSTKPSWYYAYNQAKSDANKFDGMRGYLATITSADEQFYIFKNLGGELRAWIGGARTLDNTMKYDTVSVTDGVLDPGTRYSDSVARLWQWMCGPEAGMSFWKVETSGANGEAVMNSEGEEVYNCWNSTSSLEPNCNYTNYGGTSETHSQEYALEYGFNSEANWNDYSPYVTGLSSPYGIEGYIIEYSPYTTHVEGEAPEEIKTDSNTTPDYKIIRADEAASGSFNVAASNETNPAGVAGPTKDTAASEGNNYVYNITLDSNVDSVTLTPTMNNVTIESITRNGTAFASIPAGGVVEVTGVEPSEAGKVTIKYTVKDTTNNAISTYTYIITRNAGADATPSVEDPDPSTPGIPKVDEGIKETIGTTTTQKVTITVPADQSELTIYPTPINGATIDLTYDGDGYKEETLPSGVSVTNELDDGTKPYLTVSNLSAETDTVISVKVDSEDGKSSIIYQYTIVREDEVSITPVDPTGSNTDIEENPDTENPDTATDIYKVITIPSTMDDLLLVPSLPTGATITKIVEDSTEILPIPADGKYTVEDIVSGTDRTVVYTIKLADNSIVNYHYTITKEAANSNTNITTGVQDPTPGDTSDDPVIDSSEPVKDVTIDGTTQKVKDITVTVPYKNTSITLTPEVEEITSSFDTSYGTNGIKKDSLVPGTTLADSSNVGTTDATIKLENLKAGTDNVISIKVKAQDGSTCIYRYTITRQTGTDVTVTPTGPDSTITSQIKGPEADTGKTSTNTDKYYTVTLPNGTSEVTMTPTINDGDTITSVTVDGSVVTTQPNGAYTVTGVTTDQTKEIVYTVKDPDGNEVKYHYTISQDKKADTKDPSITDITVKTGDGVGTPADIKINDNGTEKTIDITVPYNTTDYTFIPETKDPGTKITEITKVSGPADVSTSADGKSFTATGLSSETPTVVRVTTESSTGDKITYTVTINRAQEGVTPTISVEMNGGSMNLQDYIPDDVRKNAKEIIYHCCAHTVLAIDKDGTVRAIGRSTTYKNSLVHIIVKGQDDSYTDYTVYIKVTGATKKEEYGTLVDYKGLNYEITGENTCRVSSWKTNYNTKKKNIVIPDTIKANGKTYKVTAIAPGAFMRNSKIQTIKIGKNVQEIGNTSFIGLRKLTKFTVDKKNKYFKVAGKSGNLAKMILSKNGKTLYSMTNMQGTVTIPKSVTRVTEYAGAGNVKMKKLIIPASVKRIDPCAFAHASKLTYVQFKGKLPEMANNCILDQMNYKKGTVYVPKKEYTKYKTAFQSASKKRYGIQQFPSMSKLKKK
ncbi:MAG: leucine-rich repeat protein [Lachnospiraceae bacterium]